MPCVLVTISPVFTPIRPSIPSGGKASRIRTAARSARNASSSCATGTPNTATTASPMNFCTVPPYDSTIAFIPLKYATRSSSSASGSRDSAKAVEPTTSQNTTVTVLRCFSVAAVSESGAAHEPQ